jgi:hypothetical protein
MKRAIGTIGAAITTLLFTGLTPAFARQLDEPEIGGHFPVPSVPAQSAGGTSKWIIGLIVAAGVVALTAALFGSVRLYRSRTHTVAAGA